MTVAMTGLKVLAFHIQAARGHPPSYSKAFTWHWRKAAVSALRTSST